VIDLDPHDDRCNFCGGDGFVYGDELGDPLWYDDDESYVCPCCRGSGAAKDMIFQ